MASSNDSIPEEETEERRGSQVPEWFLACHGIKMIINNNSEEAQRLFLEYPNSLVMFAGYSLSVFMDALMSYEEEKLATAISVLKEVEKRCAAESGWLRVVTSRVFGGYPKSQKSLAEQLETQIILADSQVCMAVLTFLQQDISGYFKGGWVLRKAWKVYQKVYNEILQLYKENVGELNLPDPAQISLSSPTSSSDRDSVRSWEVPPINYNGYTQKHKIPHSKSAILHKTPNGTEATYSIPSKHEISSNNHRKRFSSFKKSSSVNSGLSNRANNDRWGFKFGPFNNSFSFSNFPSPLSLFSSHDTVKDANIEKEVIKRLMAAVSFGYGLFQLGISLLPPSLTKVTSILGFAADRQDGLACLMYARLGTDMRSPLATLALLWYHTIVRPFYGIDGTNVQAGVDTSTALLRESQAEFSDSALFLFFRGRVCRLNSDIKSALLAFQQAVDNSRQREIKILCFHEIGWCHLIELNYCAAESTFMYLKVTSRWSRSFYAYLAVICAGAGDLSNAIHTSDNPAPSLNAKPNSFQVGACQINLNLSLFEDLRNGIIGVPKGTQLEEFLSRRLKCCPADMDELREKNVIYWKLLVFEMLYLWNALPTCTRDNIDSIVQDCNGVSDEADVEPMKGLSKLILGSALSIQGMYNEGISNFRKCLELRMDLEPNVEDAHVSAFAQFELGALLIRKEETKEEGKELLQNISRYTKYDFQQKLDVRVYSLLRNI